MKRAMLLACLTIAFAQGSVRAQNDAWQFRWQKGQVLVYRVEHATSVVEVVDGKKGVSTSKLNLVKRWQVLDVDAKGIATLQLSLASLRNEQVRPDSETILFDSENLDKSSPELREQMKLFLNKALVTLRIDPQGQVVETLQGTQAKYEQEPPFTLVLPGQPIKSGQAWKRGYEIVLAPPQGAGEKYPAAQIYRVAKVDGSRVEVVLNTEIKMPGAAAEQVPLLQNQVNGQVVFDTRTGRTLNTRLIIDRTVENFQGPNTSYQFRSNYTETLVE